MCGKCITSDRSCYQRGGEARFQAMELRWPDCGVTDKHSVLLGRRFSCSKNKRDINFCISSFATKFISLEILSHENFTTRYFPDLRYKPTMHCKPTPLFRADVCTVRVYQTIFS